MKLVVQRVSSSSVRVDGREVARISKGLTVLFGAEKGDRDESAIALAEKTVNLRIFPDGGGKMNLSCKDVGGEVLVVSQFTLAGDCSRGRRPGFENAAPPGEAERLYLKFVEEIRRTGLTAACGIFGAHMLVDIQNDGPVTFILEG
ncbi:MAG: D-tyrosyl-tRNA(Tyr) deacylase [Nitrospinae bacterium]|nr:D-tyrosyl-tRNA(Tyr) deacylase [Nitrospinota bacterium]